MHANRLEEALAAFDEVLVKTDRGNRYAVLRAGISLLKLIDLRKPFRGCDTVSKLILGKRRPTTRWPMPLLAAVNSRQRHSSGWRLFAFNRAALRLGGPWALTLRATSRNSEAMKCFAEGSGNCSR